MANAYKEKQQTKRDADHDSLVRECRSMNEKGNMVGALKKYCAATGASIDGARRVLFHR